MVQCSSKSHVCNHANISLLVQYYQKLYNTLHSSAASPAKDQAGDKVKRKSFSHLLEKTFMYWSFKNVSVLIFVLFLLHAYAEKNNFAVKESWQKVIRFSYLELGLLLPSWMDLSFIFKKNNETTVIFCINPIFNI